MNTNVILYDRIWLNEYIDGLNNQRELLKHIEYYLQREKMYALPDQQLVCTRILLQIEELADSLEITKRTLKRYLNNAQDAMTQLQKQCQEIELPVFFR